MSVTGMCQEAMAASAFAKQLTTAQKDRLLLDMATSVERHGVAIAMANAMDVAVARESGISTTLIDRLTLTERRMAGLVSTIRTVASLPDPIGQVVKGWSRPNGLLIEQVREPLGVVAVIYEARPNVTAEVAALCLKSGNCAVLRGSSMAAQSNAAIMAALAEAVAQHAEVPDAIIQLIGDQSRETALELMQAKGLVDLLVPRGGPELIASVEQNATVPVVVDGAGNCHTYIDGSADQAMAAEIVINAKTSRPSVCNAMETLLVHEEIAEEWLPAVLDKLASLGVEIRGCPRVRSLWPGTVAAEENDWATEYLGLVLAVRVVVGVDEAVEHIGRYGTSNAEGIVCRDLDVARRFTRAVDSGSVFVNASTRYSDGGEFGYGVELGVSTQKLHVRGPMGLEALTTVKNVVWGNGQTRIV